jgi:hypothetical protein
MYVITTEEQQINKRIVFRASAEPLNFSESTFSKIGAPAEY